MTAQGGRLFPQFAFTFQVFREEFPMRGVLLDVSLDCIGIDELKGVAIVEVVVTIVNYLAINLPAAEYKVVEQLAAYKTDVCGSTGKEVFATYIEIDTGKQRDFFKQRFHRVAEAYFACVQVEPFDVVISKQCTI